MSDKPKVTWKTTMRNLSIMLYIFCPLFAAAFVEKIFVFMNLPKNSKPYDVGEVFGSAAGFACLAIGCFWIGRRLRRGGEPAAPHS
jgi:hypothetical protein